MILWRWPKTNRLPDISPAKMGLFWISRGLQFGVCDHDKPRASPNKAREGDHLYRREKELGRATVNKESKAESLPGKKRSLSSFFGALLSSWGVTALPSGLLTLFNWGLFINFLQWVRNLGSTRRGNPSVPFGIAWVTCWHVDGGRAGPEGPSWLYPCDCVLMRKAGEDSTESLSCLLYAVG